MNALLSNRVSRRVARSLAVLTIALTLVMGLNSGGVEAKRSTSLTCTTLQAGYEYADQQSRVAGYQGNTTGVAGWNQVSGALQRAYLSAGCVTPGDDTV